MHQTTNDLPTDVLVIGGGLGGLACAGLLAAKGLDVQLLERASTLGGRASTDRAHGFALNRGPHALYRGGPAREVLRALGVQPRGHQPPTAGIALRHGERHRLPGTTWSLLRTGLLRPREKLQLARWMTSLPRLDPVALDSISVTAWIDRSFDRQVVRELAATIVRLATYAAALDELSAGTAVSQLGLALAHGVDYLDGGWQTLIDALADKARSGGARIETGAAVARVVESEAGVSVALDDGRLLTAPTVVLAGGPGMVRSLAPAVALREDHRPVMAACLDLGLSRLPGGRPPRLALGLDVPLYYAVHSATVELAPPGGTTVHAAHYGEHEDARARIESMLDALIPDWRAHVVTQRFLPRMVVAHDLPQASRGGLAGRDDARLSPSGRLWAVGDWVGPQGLLADAVLASARDVAQRITRPREAVASKAA